LWLFESFCDFFEGQAIPAEVLNLWRGEYLVAAKTREEKSFSNDVLVAAQIREEKSF
jgi:hypothetical protein